MRRLHNNSSSTTHVLTVIPIAKHPKHYALRRCARSVCVWLGLERRVYTLSILMSLGTRTSLAAIVTPKTAAPLNTAISFARKFLCMTTALPNRALSLHP